MVSPILRAFPGSNWRNHVQATWKFLHQHYKLEATDDCATHIHISLEPKYTLDEIKKVAQAAIHFEPAIEVLVPKSRRGNPYCKSNWLNAPGFTTKEPTRAETIANLGKKMALRGLITAMHITGTDVSKNFCWNFCSIVNKGTIEFRKPPASLDADAALSWAELAMSFVQAAIKCESPEALQQVPANIRGLRWFLETAAVPGMNELWRLDRLWRDKDPDLILEPVWIYYDDQEWINHIGLVTEMARKDKQRLQRQAERARKPYWRKG